MKRISSGQSSAPTSLADWTTVGTIPAPQTWSGELRLIVHLSDLGAGHRLQVREVSGTRVEQSQAEAANGTDRDLVICRQWLEAGDADVLVQVIDLAGVSPAATWTWELWDFSTAAVTGDGDIPVDHNTGGADAERYFLDNGITPADNAVIKAYVAAEYDAGNPTCRGTTYTGADGRWTAPLMLNAGIAYRLAVWIPGQTGVLLREITPHA